MNIALLLSLLLLTPVACAETPQEVLNAVDAIRAPAPDFGFALRVVNQRDGKDDSEFGFRVQVKDSVKSLVSYESPTTAKGRRLLMINENMWIYVPGTRAAIRISPQQQLVGQVSNADVARVVYGLDYRPETLTAERYEDRDAYRLNLTAKSPSSTYQRVELVVAKQDSRPLLARFYALSGRLLKTLFFQDYRSVLGKSRPMRLEVVDAIRTSDRTLMFYSDMREMETPDQYFQKDFLPRL